MDFLSNTELMLVRLELPSEQYDSLFQLMRFIPAGNEMRNFRWLGIVREELKLAINEEQNRQYHGIQTHLGRLVPLLSWESRILRCHTLGFVSRQRHIESFLRGPKAFIQDYLENNEVLV